MSGTRPLTLKWSPAAVADVQRLRAFIEPHNPRAARRAAASLQQAASTLLMHPGIGKRLEGRKIVNYSYPSASAAMSSAIDWMAMTW